MPVLNEVSDPPQWRLVRVNNILQGDTPGVGQLSSELLSLLPNQARLSMVLGFVLDVHEGLNAVAYCWNQEHSAVNNLTARRLGIVPKETLSWRPLHVRLEKSVIQIMTRLKKSWTLC